MRAVKELIPGIVSTRAAASVVAEIGGDMGQFPTAAHLSSWAGLCPGNNESAGKHYSGQTRSGNVWLKRSLCQAAWAASHTGTLTLPHNFAAWRQNAARSGAIIAVAHSLLVAIYIMLKTGQSYVELGVDYFEKLHADDFKRYLVRKLEALGHIVTLAPAA